MKPLTRVFVVAATGAVLSACGGSDRNGRLSLSVTDAPVDDATAVVVQFTGVVVKPAEGSAITFDFDAPRSIDLLALAGGGSELLLDGVSVPGGRYNWVRLKVTAEEDGVLDSYLETSDGGQHELVVPSGAQSGLQLSQGFRVPAGGHAEFTIDFDLRKSVHEPMNAADSYLLRPSLRIVDNAQIGRIEGTVAAALVTEGCSPAVYVFTGAGVTPDDVDGAEPEPVTTAMPEMNTDTGDYDYRAAFLSPGDYTVAFTCDAALDDPESDDVLDFGSPQDAVVQDGQATTVDFGP